MNSQVISRERVSAHGEVFTAQREVNAMCDLIADQCNNYRATFLEPACGTGNFLVEILSRKLASIAEDHDYERKSLVALSSLYGIDILPDNVQTCRQRLYKLWDSHAEHSQAAKTQALIILQHNIVCGDTINHPERINFMEWKFPSDSITPEGTPFNLNEEITGQKVIAYED